MRMPSSRVANRIRLFLLRNPLMSIVHLEERPPMQMPHATRFSTLILASRRVEKLQPCSEQKCLAGLLRREVP